MTRIDKVIAVYEEIEGKMRERVFDTGTDRNLAVLTLTALVILGEKENE